MIFERQSYHPSTTTTTTTTHPNHHPTSPTSTHPTTFTLHHHHHPTPHPHSHPPAHPFNSLLLLVKGPRLFAEVVRTSLLTTSAAVAGHVRLADANNLFLMFSLPIFLSSPLPRHTGGNAFLCDFNSKPCIAKALPPPPPSPSPPS